MLKLDDFTYFLSHGTDGVVGRPMKNGYNWIINLDPISRGQNSNPVEQVYFVEYQHFLSILGRKKIASVSIGGREYGTKQLYSTFSPLGFCPHVDCIMSFNLTQDVAPIQRA